MQAELQMLTGKELGLQERFLMKLENIEHHSLRLRLHGTLERFCMEPFCIGTDRLPVYTISWNRSLHNEKINKKYSSPTQNRTKKFSYKLPEPFSSGTRRNEARGNSTEDS